MEQYIQDLVNLIGETGTEIGQYFTWPFGVTQWALIIIGAGLLAARKWGIAVVYVFIVFFGWGLLKVLGRVEQESFRTWANLFIYCVVGAGVGFTLAYLGIFRQKE